jgi:hypothetical protein
MWNASPVEAEKRQIVRSGAVTMAPSDCRHWIIAVIALPALSTLVASSQALSDKACPRCAEIIKGATIACRFCGYEYPAAEIEQIKAAARSPSVFGGGEGR